MTKEQQVREYCEFMGSDEEDREASPEYVTEPCAEMCAHSDCRLARALLAVLDDDNRWDDDHGTEHVIFDDMISAMHKALGLEEE